MKLILKKQADLTIYGIFSVTGTFSCTLKFIVKDCDPNTGEADDEGYDDEYVVCTATLYKNLLWVLEGWLQVKPHRRHCIVSLIKTL